MTSERVKAPLKCPMEKFMWAIGTITSEKAKERKNF